jgi:hypothetical protein
MHYTLREISSPDEVMAVLEQMRTAEEELWLEGDDKDTCITMGYDPQSKRYIVATSSPDGDWMEVFDPAKPHGRIEGVIGLQSVDVWEDSLVGFEAVKAAFSHFFAHQTRHPGLNWRVAKI